MLMQNAIVVPVCRNVVDSASKPLNILFVVNTTIQHFFVNKLCIISSQQRWHDIPVCKLLIVSSWSDLIIFVRPISFLHKPQGSGPLNPLPAK